MHPVTYVYGKEQLNEKGERIDFQTQDSFTATTPGVTHHRAKCSVCGLYLDNDYVKHSYTEYVNVQYYNGKTLSDAGYNRFAAVCECGHQVLSSGLGAKNLRQALQDAATNGIPVVHIVAPYWQVQGPEGKTDLGGMHIHLTSESYSAHGHVAKDEDTSAIKVPAGVTTVFSILVNGDCPLFPFSHPPPHCWSSLQGCCYASIHVC